MKMQLKLNHYKLKLFLIEIFLGENYMSFALLPTLVTSNTASSSSSSSSSSANSCPPLTSCLRAVPSKRSQRLAFLTHAQAMENLFRDMPPRRPYFLSCKMFVMFAHRLFGIGPNDCLALAFNRLFQANSSSAKEIADRSTALTGYVKEVHDKLSVTPPNTDLAPWCSLSLRKDADDYVLNDYVLTRMQRIYNTTWNIYNYEVGELNTSLSFQLKMSGPIVDKITQYAVDPEHCFRVSPLVDRIFTGILPISATLAAEQTIKQEEQRLTSCPQQALFKEELAKKTLSDQDKGTIVARVTHKFQAICLSLISHSKGSQKINLEAVMKDRAVCESGYPWVPTPNTTFDEDVSRTGLLFVDDKDLEKAINFIDFYLPQNIESNIHLFDPPKPHYVGVLK